MKPQIIFFLLVALIVCCNSSNKKMSQVEEITIQNIDTINSIKTPTLNISKAFVLGKFNYKNDSTFVKVNAKYSTKTIYLKAKTYTAFVNMYNAAKNDGIVLKIISGTRNFNQQKAIWERKWKAYKALKPTERAKKILEYSSMPSTSRHHWGTDIDLNNLNNSYFNSGKGKKEYEWLINNANTFGFYQVYTTKTNGRTGYNLEKWHWSYMPLASQYLESYNKRIVNDDINGFEGSNLAQHLRLINNYVNGISQKAKDFKLK